VRGESFFDYVMSGKEGNGDPLVNENKQTPTLYFLSIVDFLLDTVYCAVLIVIDST
jgi:hypothetical protein